LGEEKTISDLVGKTEGKHWRWKTEVNMREQWADNIKMVTKTG